MTIWQRLRAFFSATASTSDGPPWRRLNAQTLTEPADPYQDYASALEAWQRNPYAKRIIDLITDFCIGDGLTPTAPGDVGRFVDRFWNHRENHLDLRLPDLMDELSRSGDLFLVLFRNPQDGMSYVRAIPKSEIQDIRTAPLDWEKETEIVQRPTEPGELPTTWPTPNHPDAAAADAVMLHYSINRPVGALLGNSELQTVLPWLQRYSRMLEDRVRLNWAARAFLWFVKVPTNQVQAKAEQYAAPPEPGSIVVHDDGEQWEMKTPALHGFDASEDLKALRQIISAGSGQPPHWHGDGMDVNRATALAMNDPAVRHLRRRQRHLQHIVIDLCDTAYRRAYDINRGRTSPKSARITVELPDISREDNTELAQAAAHLTNALSTLLQTAQQAPPALRRRAIDMTLRAAGENISPDELDTIAAEFDAQAMPQPKPEVEPV